MRSGHLTVWAPVLTRAAVTVFLCFAAASGSRALGQTVFQQGFEDGETSWRPAGSDTRYQLVTQERTRQEAHQGTGSELIRIAASNGTYVYMAHPTPPARIIDELTAGVWVKSDRPGAQLLARIVLPRTRDASTGAPLSALVFGTSYTYPGQWQQLKIGGIPQLIARQARVLRSQFGPNVDVREAYIDQVLVNVYAGPGVTSVWLDDLEVAPVVSAPATQPPTAAADVASAKAGVVRASTVSTGGTPANPAALPDAREPLVRLRGATTLVGGRPTLLRIIQHQGEPLSLLQQLGFNAVLLANTPGQDVLDEARQRGLWLICPPPGVARLEREGMPDPMQPVVAWYMGSGLSGAELEQARQWAQLVRQSDPVGQRLIVAQPEVDARAYGRLVDVLLVGRHPLGTSLNLSAYAGWLKQQFRLVRPGTPVWARIQTDLDPLILKQWDALGSPGAGVSAGGLAAGTYTADADMEQIRLLVRSALAAGARGLLFDSRSSLTAGDGATRRRRLALELINLELATIELWAAGGSFVTAASCSDPKVVGASLQAERARLLLPIHWGREDQFVPEPLGGESRSFIIPGVPESNEAYELTPAGMRPLRHNRVTGGIRVVQDKYADGAAIVMTSDAHVVSSLMRQAAQIERRAAGVARELAARKLELVEAVVQRVSPGASAKPGSKLAGARASLIECDRLYSAGDMRRAYQQAEATLSILGQIQHTLWSQRIGVDRSVIANPLATSFLALPRYVEFSPKAGSAPARPLALPGGDFEEVSGVVQSGWQHFRHPTDGVVSEVELSPQDAHGGGYCLRMRTAVEDPAAPQQALESAPVWVTSPAVAVSPGQILRISGWVAVPQPIVGSFDGLMILDSCTGLPLAERIVRTGGWKQFTLYRAVSDADTIRVTFALSGLGEARLDDVVIEAVDLQK